MSLINTLVFVVASVTLFIYGLQSFSREIQILAMGRLQKFLAIATQNRVVAAITGAIATAFLQSSSAVSALAVTLTDSGILNLRAVMAIMIGANIGTASTAFLVSFKIHGIGGYLLVLGSLVSLLTVKYRVVGKTLFYFGFIFFALDQISLAMQPFQHLPIVVELLGQADVKILGVFFGMLLTALLQSSSVVTGIIVMLAQEELVSVQGAVAVVLGANVGTTATAIVASLTMGRQAKASAIANLLFNILGVMMVFPFINRLAEFSSNLGEGSLGLTVAYSHLIFNILIGILFLIFLSPCHDFINRKISK